MSTRANVLVIERKWAEDFEEGFAVDPVDIIEKSYINMYMHHDGYPTWRGMELANWIEHKLNAGWSFADCSRVTAQLVHDFHYNSQYLYPNHVDVDTNYTYILWLKPGGHEPWISIWNRYTKTCEFVGKAEKLVKKYKPKAEELDKWDYTDWNYKLKTNVDG